MQDIDKLRKIVEQDTEAAALPWTGKAARGMEPGFPYGVARAMGGGGLLVFGYFATLGEAEAAISRRPNPAVPMFPVYLPHLNQPLRAEALPPANPNEILQDLDTIDKILDESSAEEEKMPWES